jgi:phosphoserine phosphatase RsbU/P
MTGQGSSSPRRAGVPLSIKLILTTSFVVSGAVGASAFFSQRAIEGLAAADAASRRDSGLAAIQSESVLLSRNVAALVSLPLGTEQFIEVQPLIEDADRDYDRIVWLLVLDHNGRVVAATDGGPVVAPGVPYEDALTPVLADAAAGTVDKTGEGTDWIYGTPIHMRGTRVGELRAGVSTAELERALVASLADADRRAEQATREMALVAISLLAIGVVLAALQGFRVARPLRLLAYQADRIAHGDLDQRVPERGGDEIGMLARNFNFMAGQLGQLLVENAQKASLEREMTLARQVQQAMLPATDLVVHGQLRLVGHCVPASSCGGDWWTYRKLSGGRALIVIGDATGHGLHSALIASTARGAVEALADADERLLTPEQVLKAIHAAISGIGDHSMLMTCFSAVLDPTASTVHYANAGQNFPYVMRRGSDGAFDEAQIIAASGNPLGDRSVQQTLRRGSVPMHAGDMLVAFTDGVVERSNPGGKLFGDRRLRGVFRGQQVDTGGELIDLRERIVTAIDAFADGTTAQDDVTFVLVQCEPADARRQRTAS